MLFSMLLLATGCLVTRSAGPQAAEPSPMEKATASVSSPKTSVAAQAATQTTARPEELPSEAQGDRRSQMENAIDSVRLQQNFSTAQGATPTTALPEPPSEVAMSDANTRTKYLLALQSYYEYRTKGYEYRSRVFEWQLHSSRTIFVIVLLLVGAGIYFAAVQFHVALSTAKRGAKKTATKGGEGATAEAANVGDKLGAAALSTQLEITAKGVIVNSSVMGVVILALSLAFFYLFLVYVYPIQNVI